MTGQESKRLAILGCGFMGTAILQGLLSRPDEKESWQYAACVRSERSMLRLQKDVGSRDNVSFEFGEKGVVAAANGADVVMLGCAPGDLETLLSMPGLADKIRNSIIISLLAGVSIQQVRKILAAKSTEPIDEDALQVVRTIPSIGAKIGDSVTLLAADNSDAQNAVQSVFCRVGSVLPVPESLMNEATAIGAACHALAMTAVDAITDAGVAEGMDRQTASSLAAQSLRSASNLFCAGGMTPEQLKTAMSTPLGITINSVLRLQANNVPAGVADAARSAVKYARSM